MRCPIQCTCTRLTNPPPTHPRHVQVPASVLRDAAVAGLPDLTAHPGTGAAVERRATREEAAHLLLAGERVMACWQGGARWEPGEVLSVRKSPASCAVLFDDQCYEANVPCASVRRMTADEEVHAQRARATQFMGMEARARARTPVCAKVHECWCCLPSGLPVLALERGAPTTLHPTPYTLHPTPYTLHPYPPDPYPTPYTLHHPPPPTSPRWVPSWRATCSTQSSRPVTTEADGCRKPRHASPPAPPTCTTRHHAARVEDVRICRRRARSASRSALAHHSAQQQMVQGGAQRIASAKPSSIRRASAAQSRSSAAAQSAGPPSRRAPHGCFRKHLPARTRPRQRPPSRRPPHPTRSIPSLPSLPASGSRFSYDLFRRWSSTSSATAFSQGLHVLVSFDALEAGDTVEGLFDFV